MMLYGVAQDGRKGYRVNDCVFENAASGLSNGKNTLERCTFRNMGIAVLDYGALDAVLTDCVFENNEQNWVLAYSDKGLVFVDCAIGAASKPNYFRCWTNPATQKKQYPSFASRRHVIVQVVDAQGKAVAGAQVVVKNEQDVPENVDNGKSLTDAQGNTPGKGDKKAILLTEVLSKATDAENQPETREFTYGIEVSAAGYSAASVKGFRPVKSWDVVKVTLQKP